MGQLKKQYCYQLTTETVNCKTVNKTQRFQRKKSRSYRRCSIKKVLLKILQNLQENTCTQSLFLCKREMMKQRKTSFNRPIAKFFCVTWPNFTIVKYNCKISIIYHEIKTSNRYNDQVFNKKAVLKDFAIFTEKHLRWSLLLNKNAGLQS